MLVLEMRLYILGSVQSTSYKYDIIPAQLRSLVELTVSASSPVLHAEGMHIPLETAPDTLFL